MEELSNEAFNHLLEKASPAIESKKNELHSLGYEDVTNDLVIDCLQMMIWKKNRPNQIYKIVQDILNLKSSTYMSYISSKTYVDDDLMSSITAVIGENEDESK